IKSGKHTWQDTVRWSRVYFDGYGKKRKKVFVPVEYSLMDVVKAVMIASDNDCAGQLAIYIGDGSLSTTIEKMNLRASELGMSNTIYRNPSGLPGSQASLDNSSTPVDQLKLGLELLKYEEVLQITSMGFAQVNDGRTSSVLRNHNGLTIDYSGQIDGLKTGYTRRAGYCLVGTTEKCGHRLVSVVLGCNSPSSRNEVVRNMFNAYYVSIGLDPIGKFCPIPDFARRDTQMPDSASGKWVVQRESARQIHKVRSGENLYRIADKYGCSVNQLKSWNNGSIPASGKIRIGQSLVVQTLVTRKKWVPDQVQKPEEQTAVSDPMEVVVPESPLYHTVTPGDTLYSIAKKYGVSSIDQLKSMNNIPDGNIIPGMRIKVKVDG
ncbi:MAG: LysM peptidoglycan-binding domain-containing protein, partial [Bacteroidota bacterium]